MSFSPLRIQTVFLKSSFFLQRVSKLIFGLRSVRQCMNPHWKDVTQGALRFLLPQLSHCSVALRAAKTPPVSTARSLRVEPE